MIRPEEVYKIGMFNKPHGIGGELQFTFTDDIFDRVEAEYVVCPMDGILVPFFIEAYRFRSDTTALMKLEGVDTQEQARQFINTTWARWPTWIPPRPIPSSSSTVEATNSWYPPARSSSWTWTPSTASSPSACPKDCWTWTMRKKYEL